MAISLKKNSGINLEKGLKNLILTVSWDTKMDIDIHALLLTDGRAGEDDDFIFYGNLEHPSGAIIHSGDVKDGSRATGVDDEYITIVMDEIPPIKNQILLSASIHNAVNRGQHFGKATDAVCKLIDKDTNEVLVQYALDQDLIGEHCAKIAQLTKEGSVWRFTALGQPMPSLERILLDAGLEVE
jgi:tellurium resistance protein TerD|nr:MAG TPA: TerD-like protein [Caudoviricetes sp.]